MNTLTLRAGGLALAAALLMAGCAAPRLAQDQPGWSGRLALTVAGSSAQSFSAAFDLRGSPAAGQLSLFTPLGSTAAVLAWAPGGATLRSGGEEHRFGSLEALAEAATGAPLPVASLFDWLAGRATPVPGWEVDVSGLGKGRLVARRTSPPPTVDLRVALDR